MPVIAAMSPPAHLIILRRDLRCLVGQHLAGPLRVDERFPAALAQRVEDDDRHVALAHLLKVVQQPRRVRADVLAKEKMQSVLAKSSSSTVPTGVPMLWSSATDVVSWHMLELSSRLLLP